MMRLPNRISSRRTKCARPGWSISCSPTKLGLKAEIGGRSLQEIAREVLEIAGAGLKARARAAAFDDDETHFLSALQEIAASGRTAADELLDHYHGDWGGDLDRIYADYSY